MLCHPKWEREREGWREAQEPQFRGDFKRREKRKKKKKGRRQAASIEASKQMLSSALRARGPLCFQYIVQAIVVYTFQPQPSLALLLSPLLPPNSPHSKSVPSRESCCVVYTIQQLGNAERALARMLLASKQAQPLCSTAAEQLRSKCYSMLSACLLGLLGLACLLQL